jgi:NitT/TauT family transport system substrate-binding protein
VRVAATRALQNRPDEIKSVLRAHLVLTSHARADPKEFARRAGAAFAKITGKALPEAILLDAFSRIELTTDPMEAELMIAARHAKELGFLPSDDIAGLVDASLLEQIRTEKVAPRP